jgi:hypothetical protein
MALTIGLTITIVVIAGGFSLVALSGAVNAPAPVAGTYTFSADWTLLDLERHIDAGEVATISLVSGTTGAAVGGAGTASNASTDVLAARTTSGQWVRVTLAVSPSDALVALRSLGFGRLIATDSVAQLPPTNGVSGSGSQSSDPVGGIVQLAMLGVVLAVALVLLRRNGIGSSKLSSNYEVILPAWTATPVRLPGRCGSPTSPAAMKPSSS